MLRLSSPQRFAKSLWRWPSNSSRGRCNREGTGQGETRASLAWTSAVDRHASFVATTATLGLKPVGHAHSERCATHSSRGHSTEPFQVEQGSALGAHIARRSHTVLPLSWLSLSSQLAVSTAALIVPVVLLRRSRANALARTLREAPPPPRRTTTTAFVPGIPVANVPRVKPTTSTNAAPTADSEMIDDFNGALYSAKAFGYATLMVVTGASLTVWGVKSYMGVQNVSFIPCHLSSLVESRLPDGRVRA